MLEQNFQLIHNGSPVRSVRQSDIISFVGFNKALGYAIALRGVHRRCNWPQIQGPSKGSYFTRVVTRPITRKRLHFMGISLTGSKLISNSLHHNSPTRLSSMLLFVTTQLMTSRSQQSKSNTTRTFSPLSHTISKPSERHRVLL